MHPFSGRRYHLVVHQAIHMPDMDHHLLCPMQCRTNGVKLNKCPRMFCGENVTEEDHAMVAFDEKGERVVLPFFLKGVTSYMTVEALSREEWEMHACPRIELTSEHLTWDPTDTVFEDQENATLDYQGDIVRPGIKERIPLMTTNYVVTSTCVDVVKLDSGDNLAEALDTNINVSHLRVVKPRVASQIRAEVGPKFGNLQSVRWKPVSAELLAKHWISTNTRP